MMIDVTELPLDQVGGLPCYLVPLDDLCAALAEAPAGAFLRYALADYIARRLPSAAARSLGAVRAYYDNGLIELAARRNAAQPALFDYLIYVRQVPDRQRHMFRLAPVGGGLQSVAANEARSRAHRLRVAT